MFDLFQIITALEQAPTLKEKEDILREVADYPLLKEVVFLSGCIYDFGVRGDQTTRDPKRAITREVCTFYTHAIRLFCQLAAQEIVGDAAVKAVEYYRDHASLVDDDLFMRVLNKDLGCGLTPELINEIWPGLVY